MLADQPINPGNLMATPRTEETKPNTKSKHSPLTHNT